MEHSLIGNFRKLIGQDQSTIPILQIEPTRPSNQANLLSPPKGHRPLQIPNPPADVHDDGESDLESIHTAVVHSVTGGRREQNEGASRMREQAGANAIGPT